MQTSEAIRGRRAVKNFDPAQKMSAAEETALFDLAQLAPSSTNIQHWRIVNVKDPGVREQIKAAAWGQAQMTDASLLLVICADTKAWDKNPQQYWSHVPDETRDYLVKMMHDFYSGNQQLQRDEAFRSVGLIAQTIMLAAKDMGYDSCPMIGFDAAKVAETIHLPADHVVGMVVTVGKAAAPAHPRGSILPRETVVLTDRF